MAIEIDLCLLWSKLKMKARNKVNFKVIIFSRVWPRLVSG